jgi:hypothetical protein
MSWYTLAQDTTFALAKTIAQWLVQAYRGPVDMQLVNSDINGLMPRIDDENAVDSALVAGENQARAMTGQTGELTLSQQDLINNIRLRLQNPQGNAGLNNVSEEQPQNDQTTQTPQDKGEYYVENS